MERYLALGVRELIALFVEAEEGSRLMAWDRIENDLVPRVVEGETTPCLTLGLHWVLRETRAPSGELLPFALRLAKDASGRELVLMSSELAEQENARLRALLAARDD